MKIAVYPGSFDPVTLGHLDIIQRVEPLFDELVVLVSSSIHKRYLFTAEERKRIIEECIGNSPRLRVDLWDGLTVDYCLKQGASVLIRGLRMVGDFDHELVMSQMNRRLTKKVETLLIYGGTESSYISSTIVKEVASHHGDLSGLVPKPVEAALKKKFAQSSK